MKFEEFLMQTSEDHQRRLALEDEVLIVTFFNHFLIWVLCLFHSKHALDYVFKVKKLGGKGYRFLQVMKLQAELDGEQMLNSILQCALDGPLLSHSCPFSCLPSQV